jgi:alcohol dehydrogenase class IV
VAAELRFGAGSIAELPEVLAGLAARRVLIVASDGTRRRIGALADLPARLGSGGCGWFSRFAANPRLADVRRGIAAARALDADTVVAVGGGTALDLGKLIALFADRTDDPEAYVVGGAELGTARSVRLVLVPTTSGTGSESTAFAVVYVGTTKHSVDAPVVRADVAIVDPELSWTMPPRLSAVTGADALSQAIESYWSVRSTEESRALAGAAVAAILERLAEQCGPAPGARCREAMSRAALNAGRAIDVTRTTAPHAVSYPLTALFGIPHGHGCALTLPHFVAYNAGASGGDTLDARGPSFVTRRIEELLALLDAATPEGGRDRLLRLFATIGLETKLGPLGVRPDDVPRLVRAGLDPRRAANNPRRVSAEALDAMLHSIV